ncbi:hypothetical protein LA345_39630 (plasmid) [Burkholderia vietnamiensis]|nr:hypothetical protein [Burkholderia vietnamiensis]
MDRANQAGISRPPAFPDRRKYPAPVRPSALPIFPALSFSSAALGKALRAIEILAGLSFVAGLGARLAAYPTVVHFRRASARQFCEHRSPGYETP